MKKGVLLINLGTPDEPTPIKVKTYLKQFLMDPYVLDIAYPLRWFLVNVLIVPKRSHSSAEAYKKVWTEEGSPLLLQTKKMTMALQNLMGSSYVVDFAMRYQNPSIEKKLESMSTKDVESLLILPLYPQYAESSTRSSIEEFKRIYKKLNLNIPYKIINDFYDHPEFIEAFTSAVKEEYRKQDYDLTVFSFHGLPVRHVQKLDSTKNYCYRVDSCCHQINEKNRWCYRAQCFATARALAEKFDLKPHEYTVTFQSRLGRDPWIKPYTDIVLNELPKKNIKRIAVFCPSFVADCLETLEEIGMRAKEEFISHGGEELVLLPLLNDHPRWIESLKNIILKQN